MQRAERATGVSFYDLVRTLVTEPAGMADTAFLRNGPSVRQLRRNLQRVKPELSHRELEDLVHSGMRSYMRYWCEAFRLPAWGPDRVNSTFDLENKHLMDAAIESGSGALMVVGHFGNWDHAGAWANLRHQQVTSVAERLEPGQRCADAGMQIGRAHV